MIAGRRCLDLSRRAALRRGDGPACTPAASPEAAGDARFLLLGLLGSGGPRPRPRRRPAASMRGRGRRPRRWR
ncbi:hypothetical protein ACU4GR_21300 [Methylobacterium oryzae CBMB20]